VDPFEHLMTARPGYSCALAPAADVVDKARLAERLGYQRVWLVRLTGAPRRHVGGAGPHRVRDRRIGLATGIAVPSLRHPMVTASAIGSIHELAPGRLIVAVGTGYTARHTLGKRPIPWADTVRYVRQVRALLNGRSSRSTAGRAR
jgi:5,10-methylenetetrahydromethanopterin reductase